MVIRLRNRPVSHTIRKRLFMADQKAHRGGTVTVTPQLLFSVTKWFVTPLVLRRTDEMVAG